MDMSIGATANSFMGSASSSALKRMNGSSNLAIKMSETPKVANNFLNSRAS